jgi:RimJ/RimL family protein N-acetyltransferase
MSGVEHVRTPQLAGTPPGDDDLDFLAALLGDERVGRTLGGARGRDEVAGFLATEREHWARNGFGYWLWRERSTGEPVARGGLHRVQVEGEEMFELGWAVAPGRWGRGYATELGRASIEAGAQLGLDPVVAYTLPDNLASRRVMEKLGMTYDRTFIHGRWGPHVLYRVPDVGPAIASGPGGSSCRQP